MVEAFDTGRPALGDRDVPEVLGIASDSGCKVLGAVLVGNLATQALLAD